jgi:cytosine/adenosine deaminase-related metal-dependent hydrolase
MIIRARYALTPGVPLIENAVLEIRGGRVDALRSAAASGEAADVDYGDALLLPGLVNAHTHLELSGLCGQVPYAGCFADWAERVMETAPAQRGPDQARAGVRDGICRSLRAGVTTVADIGYGPHGQEELARSPLRAVCFREILGRGPKRDPALTWLGRCAEELSAAPPKVWVGLSPHAPYSTDDAVYEEALHAAESRGWPVTTHLAETREEIEFLATGGGPLRDLLDRRGALDAASAPFGGTPVEFAERVGLLESGALLVHMNYLTDGDLEMVAGSPCSVAYCPRAHAFFEHGPHRFREMLAAGINVCLGTDSLASNDSLSVMDEWRFLHRARPELDLPTLLRMSTIGAAAALGIDGEVGSLEPGKLADFIAIPVSSLSPGGVEQEVLSQPIEPRAVWVGGREVSVE